MKVHILTDNRVNHSFLLAEHGLSMLIEYHGRNILFDTGTSNVFVHNATRMDLSMNRLDAVVLSHGHYDHGGGLPHLPTQAVPTPVFVRPTAFSPKYARNPDGLTRHSAGFEWKQSDFGNTALRFVETGELENIFPDVTLCSNIPYTQAFEETPSGLFTEESGKVVPDRAMHEQLMVIRTTNGLVVFCGCAHPGIVNCLTHVQRLFSNTPLHAVFCGTHLRAASQTRLQSTLQALDEMAIPLLVPMHCTGLEGICALQQRLGDRCRALCAGDTLVLED